MIILASQSPRRREILEKMGLEFRVCPAEIGEKAEERDPRRYVLRLAGRKAVWVWLKHKSDTVIAADTVVCLGSRIMGKPKDREEAFFMLKSLSGKRHHVYTGVYVISKGRIRHFCEDTAVYFREISDGLIREYVESGEPMDKAGAYGAQSAGGRFVSRIEGDFYNVMGLPMCSLSCVLEELGVMSGGNAG